MLQRFAVCYNLLQCVVGTEMLRRGVIECIRACCSVFTVCCSVLLCVSGQRVGCEREHILNMQCVAVCCSVLQCVAVCCSVLQCVAVCCSVLQCGAIGMRCTVTQFSVNTELCYMHGSVYICVALQHTATHCNALQHTATHCNTLQHTATHCNTALPKEIYF